MIDSQPREPGVFVSYSWDDEQHRGWVHNFAARLRADGVDAQLDQWNVSLGDSFQQFMERAVRENDFVLVICTPQYKERSDGRVGGVGYEGDIMTAEVLSNRNRRKFIPVLREGDWNNALPSWLSGRAGVDLRGANYSEEEYKRLVDELHGQTPQAPPLGRRPDRVPSRTVAAVAPGIRPGQLPSFHELGEFTFQDLCRDLFDAEPSVATCEVYGRRGQAQHGIDLLAQRADGTGIEVGQCKCYERFTPTQIVAVTREFFEHYGTHWHHRNVERFVLFVAADLSSTQHQETVLEEARRFAAFGIRYEVWSAAKIRNKLRPHPGIVSDYLIPSDYWVRVICGSNLTTLSAASIGSNQAAGILNAGLLEWVGRLESEDAERRLEDMRTAWREGRRRETLTLLGQLKRNTASWEAISPQIKARLLRFEASARLHVTGDVGLANELADEAHALSPDDDEARIRALITRSTAGPGPAAELLAGRRDVDSVSLRASLLLEQGDISGYRETLEALEEEHSEHMVETAQLRALLHLLDKEVDRARLSERGTHRRRLAVGILRG